MSFDIAKSCSDFLRSSALTDVGVKLQASHARELVAALFGYKSHSALLAEKAYPLDVLGEADVLVPNIPLIEQRRSKLQGLPAGLYASSDIAAKVSGFLIQQGHFTGEVWLYDSLESYVVEVLLREEDGHILDLLSGVMAETNAYFDEDFGHYEVTETIHGNDDVTLTIQGTYCGSSDTERPFCGDQIDVTGIVELPRVAGRAAFAKPNISVNGEVNQDWVDPELRFGTSGSQQGQKG
jgi:hypothetical protein